jgi:outer membrane protein OmpA-like peptidoglycan-associated protein
MKKLSLIIAVLFLLLPGDLFSQATTQDVKGSKDHPLISRMPDFWISEYKVSEYDSYKFIGADKKPLIIEGHKYSILYKITSGSADPGALKIIRNVQDALKKIGGKVILDDAFNKLSTIMVRKDGKETWIEARAYSGIMYRITIVEREIMKQEIVADAKAMGTDINNTGHVSVYGIFFDTGKSELKPESDSALIQISKLLKSNATLKLYVVGHTDNVGTLESNMKLSNDRAIEVAKALVLNYGIDNERVQSYGVGSLAPVASNDTEEGKAKNRRVELVKQ